MMRLPAASPAITSRNSASIARSINRRRFERKAWATLRGRLAWNVVDDGQRALEPRQLEHPLHLATASHHDRGYLVLPQRVVRPEKQLEPGRIDERQPPQVQHDQ